MAITFNKLKDPKLGMLDKITFGKLAGCRICDVIEDHSDYLIWAEKSGFVKFQPEVIRVIQDHADFERWESPNLPEKVDVFMKTQIFGNYTHESDVIEDVPF